MHQNTAGSVPENTSSDNQDKPEKPRPGTGAAKAGAANGGPKTEKPKEVEKPKVTVSPEGKPVVDFDQDKSKKKKAKTKKPKKCKACKGKGKSSKGSVCVPCDGTGNAKEETAEKTPPKGEAAKKETPPAQEKDSKSEPAKSDTKPPEQKIAAAPANSPFKRQSSARRRVKMFAWGSTGTGKTTLALQFPGVAVIDMDNGTEPYENVFPFEVKQTTNADDVMDLIKWLAENEHPYRTLVIDPITIYWEALQKKWSDIFLVRNKKSKGFKFEYYDMQVKDWQTLKAELKAAIRAMLALDMNIVVTAREKTHYKDGDFMRTDGVTYDAEKSLPYMFDTVLHLTEEGGKRLAYCEKDRWHMFPQGRAFTLNYSTIEELWGKDDLGRVARKVILPPDEETYSQDKQKITPERLKMLNDLLKIVKLPLAASQKGFQKYGVERPDDLSPEQGEEIIVKLKALRDKGGYKPNK